ncbi:MAG: hypothetical protein DSY87_04940 [Methylococcus sp.]|nr:MAG: hypothetical protein DSY87_04940 [Methylococcus sp.]
MQNSVFSSRVLRWASSSGRGYLPWQTDITPYRVWVSEIMLQQTRAETVIPYFEKFIQRFPEIRDLADAPIDTILFHWSGLGYYARARNLHKAASIVAAQGSLPDTLEELCNLPGIGRSTAGAILSIGFDMPAPILDGNVKRVLARYRGVEGWPGASKVNRQLWELSAQYTPQRRNRAYTQAIMDLGATVCTPRKPRCDCCPLTVSWCFYPLPSLAIRWDCCPLAIRCDSYPLADGYKFVSCPKLPSLGPASTDRFEANSSRTY